MYDELPEVIDYNFHVKPILSDRCYACHGPDENARKAAFRLDLEEGAFARLKESGGHAFVKGNISRSEAWKRITSDDPNYQMPPPESKLNLSAREIALITKWIDQGAEWKPHWSFIPPDRPEIPVDFPDEWDPQNALDNFIYSTLSANSLNPSPATDKERLLRRVSLDLTGLPPSVAEMNDFIDDNSSSAYEKVVDRLLASEQFGERMAMEWMDVSRYADSHGLHADGWRMMWPWRDWVINAFNQNMSYDEFITWQIAGDLLPEATQEQILATAFHRNHAMTAEGGAIDEEFRLSYVIDRTNTTATALMGMTMECASCHDHKFDPISQREYYQMSAFFNNVKELGMTGDDGNYGPMLLMTTDNQETQIEEIQNRIRAKEEELRVSSREFEDLKSFIDSGIGKYKLEGHYAFETKGIKRGKTDSTYFDGNLNAISPGAPDMVDGKVGKAIQLDEEFEEVYLKEAGQIELYDPYSALAWIKTYKQNPEETQVIMGNAGDKNNFWRGWDFYLDEKNRLSVRLIHSLPHNYIQITSVASIDTAVWNHVAFTYDGSAKAKGLKLYINGELADSKTDYDRLYKSILTIKVGNHLRETRPLRVGKSYRLYTGESGIFIGAMDELRLYRRSLSADEIESLARNSELSGNRQKANYDLEKIRSELRRLRKKWMELIAEIPEVMVLEEMPSPRPTFVLARGQYDQPTERVDPATPESVLTFPDHLPKNRLGLAQWLFLDENPLTARVAVNRYWQMIFGRGLVNTPNDFGSQGSLPSHPALLDWLAVEFRESGWDLKYLIKLMVMSNVYRQSSKSRPDLDEIDPDNIWLARSPSYRLPAEMIRDNALAVSGLLNAEIGGESARPYQPDGLWIELGNFSFKLLHYKQDSGNNLYRRSLYTFIRRTSPPPYMTTFDVPSRDVCVVRREITNTPLQALVLLNDPQFVEAAKVLAYRSLLDNNGEIRNSITDAFRRTTSRKPKGREIDVLESIYETQKKKFKNAPEQIDQLLSIGELEVDLPGDNTSLAAMTMVANTILNHDETYMKR